MVAGKSPEWLPSGFTEKVKHKNGRRIKYYHNASTGAIYHSKKGVLSSITEENSLLGMPKTSNGNENDSPSDSQIDAGLDITDGSPNWLPDGWLSEEKTRERSSRSGSTYKVYTDVSSGKKFYSREAVTQYLSTVDRADTANVQTEFDKAEEPSPNCLSMINTDGIPEEQKDDSFKTLDKVDDPSTHTSPQCQSMITRNTGSISKKKKDVIFKTVHVEPAAVDDLPPGWIKEIITRKCGKRTRKDPYYTDPVSGYTFRSKPDALRFIKTNNIGSCAIRPKKRKLGDLNLAKNENLSPIPAHEKSPEHEGHVSVGEESNGCLQNPDTKGPSISEPQIPIQTTSNNNDTDGVSKEEPTETVQETIVTKEPSVSEAQIPKQTTSNNNDTDGVSKEEPTETVQETISTKEPSVSEPQIPKQTTSNNNDTDGVSKQEPTETVQKTISTKGPSISEAQIPKQTISNNNDTDGVSKEEPTETVQETISTKRSSISEAQILKQTTSNDSDIDGVSKEEPTETVHETISTKGPSISEAQILKQTINNNNDTDGVSKEEPTETVQEKSINSRKRKAPNSPSQVSKRISGSGPETVSDSAVNERSLSTEEANPSQPSDIELARETEPPKETEVEPPKGAEIEPPKDAEIEPPKEAKVEPPREAEVEPPKEAEIEPPREAEVEPPKEAEVEPPKGAEIEPPREAEVEPPKGAEIEPPKEAEVEPPKEAEVEPPKEAEIEPPKETEVEPPKEAEIEPPPTDAKNPPNGNPAIVLPEEKNKQESPLLLNFGKSWADPLEFALKTLRGDIPIESLAASPGYFNVNLSIPDNKIRMDDCLRPSLESDVPNIFQNKAPGTSKQEGGTHSFSGLGNIGLPDFDSFGGQPNIDVGKKDNQVKLN